MFSQQLSISGRKLLTTSLVSGLMSFVLFSVDSSASITSHSSSNSPMIVDEIPYKTPDGNQITFSTWNNERISQGLKAGSFEEFQDYINGNNQVNSSASTPNYVSNDYLGDETFSYNRWNDARNSQGLSYGSWRDFNVFVTTWQQQRASQGLAEGSWSDFQMFIGNPNNVNPKQQEINQPSVQASNSNVKATLPNTGESDQKILSTIGLSLMASTLYMANRRKNY